MMISIDRKYFLQNSKFSKMKNTTFASYHVKVFADKPLFLLIDFESFYLVTISTGNQVCKVL